MGQFDVIGLIPKFQSCVTRVLLVCLIAFFASSHECGFSCDARQSILHVSEMSNPFYLKCICISNTAVKIDGQGSRTNLLDIGNGQRRWRNDVKSNPPIGGSRCFSLQQERHTWGQAGFERKFSNANLCPMDYIKCWSLARIFYIYNYNRPFFWPKYPRPRLNNSLTLCLWGWRSSNIHQINCVYKNISSQLSSSIPNNYENSCNQSKKLEEGSNASYGCDFLAQTPTIKPFFVFILIVVTGFILCLFGITLIGGARGLLGIALCIIGMLLGVWGYLIWFPIHSLIWQWTWGWLL